MSAVEDADATLFEWRARAKAAEARAKKAEAKLEKVLKLVKHHDTFIYGKVKESLDSP